MQLISIYGWPTFKSKNISFLVGGWSTHLTNMLVKWDHETPNIRGDNSKQNLFFVSNHPGSHSNSPTSNSPWCHLSIINCHPPATWEPRHGLHADHGQISRIPREGARGPQPRRRTGPSRWCWVAVGILHKSPGQKKQHKRNRLSNWLGGWTNPSEKIWVKLGSSSLK